MAIEKMVLVNIAGTVDELNNTLKACCDSGCFHIEPAVSGNESRIKLLSEKNPYDAPLKKMAQLAQNLDIKLKETDYSDFDIERSEDFSQLCDKIEQEFLNLSSTSKAAAQSISEINGALVQIDHLKGLNSDFDRIFSCKHVSVRVGKLPADNLPKLDYYKENFFFVPFQTDKNFCWGMYFCPKADKAEVDEIFHSMFFERIIIPDFVKGNTDEAIERLNSQLKENQKNLDSCKKQLEEIAQRYESEIQQAFSKLKMLHYIFSLRRNAGVIKDKFFVKGFVPKKKQEEFERQFSGFQSVSVVFMPPDADASCTPPTVLKNNRLTRPFAMMVEMYGLPDYDGFNPTAFVAITYTILFGIMFGDLGQGFLIVLLGLIVGRKFNKQAGGMMSRVGISSMIFGTLYGSVFGFEELLDPVYESLGISFLPIKVFKQTNFILLTAVGIGVALIIMSMIINIYIGFKQKDYEKAIFGCNGIAGLVFYSSVAAGAVGTMMFDIKVMSAPFVIFLIVIPLVCIFCRVPFSIALKYKEWRLSADEEDMTIGGFIVENFFEMFEFLLSYISNTMSFLRVGGFVLSHAGMMLVVMTLMEGCGAIGKPFVFVLGNLFVMAMEGMIVAIQIIRLEFYEIFSRFNDGSGKPFEPVGIKFSAVVE